MNRRLHRGSGRRPGGAALISAIVLLVIISAVAALLLSVHTAQLSSETAGVQRLRAEAAALAASQLTLWKIGSDSGLKSDLSRVVYENDTSFSATPLFQVTGDLVGASFVVDVWPGPDTLRLKSRGVSGGYYYDRWSHMPMASSANFGNENIESSELGGVAGEQIATLVTLTEDGTLTSITAHVKGASPKQLRYAIYADSTGEPGALIVQSNAEAAGNQWHWHTIDVAPTALTAGNYWLALAFEFNIMDVKISGTGVGQLRHKNHDAVADGFASPWDAPSVSDTTRISIYATYTPE